jgi:hypothetical protein
MLICIALFELSSTNITPVQRFSVNYLHARCVQKKLAVIAEKPLGWAAGCTSKAPYEESRKKTDAQTGRREACTPAVQIEKAQRKKANPGQLGSCPKHRASFLTPLSPFGFVR